MTTDWLVVEELDGNCRTGWKRTDVTDNAFPLACLGNREQGAWSCGFNPQGVAMGLWLVGGSATGKMPVRIWRAFSPLVYYWIDTPARCAGLVWVTPLGSWDKHGARSGGAADSIRRWVFGWLGGFSWKPCPISFITSIAEPMICWDSGL